MKFSRVPSFYVKPHVALLDLAVSPPLCKTFCAALAESFGLETYDALQPFRDRLAGDTWIEDVRESSRDLSDESCDRHAVLTLDYRSLSQQLEELSRTHPLVSLLFMNVNAHQLGTIACTQFLRTEAHRILVTDDLDSDAVLSAFNAGIMHHALSLPAMHDNRVTPVNVCVRTHHKQWIEHINARIFGDFYTKGSYKTLFETQRFVDVYTHIIATHSIIFACVYEAGGSMILRDMNNQSFLLNIYSTEEINHVLCASSAFDMHVSAFNKKNVADFICIIDYKNNNTDRSFFDASLSHNMTDMFTVMSVGEETYYITFRPTKASLRF